MASRYTREGWNTTTGGNTSRASLRSQPEKGNQPPEPATTKGSENSPARNPPPGASRIKRSDSIVPAGSDNTSYPAASQANRQSPRQEGLPQRSNSLQHRVQHPTASAASTTNFNAASFKETHPKPSASSTLGSLDGRLLDAEVNTFLNRGRDRSEILSPKRSPTSGSAVRVSDPTPKPSVACGTDFTPTIKSLLDYQRTRGYGHPNIKPVEIDPRLDQRRPGETVYKYCNVCTDEVSKPTWCVHPELEDPAFDLIQDAINNRGHVQINGREFIIEQPPIRSNLKTLFRMIHPKNLYTLLTENVHENVTSWIVFTTNGTLLSYSEGTTIDQGRTVAALTGRAWRENHERCLHGMQDYPESTSWLRNVKISPYGSEGKSWGGLRCMFAEVNGMVVAVHDIKERLLVAGMLSLDAINESKEEVASEQMKSLHVFDEVDPAVKEASEAKESGDVSKSVSSSNSAGSRVSARSEGSQYGKGKGKAAEDDEGTEKKISKKDILMMKVEAMADSIADELADFKMPDEFY